MTGIIREETMPKTYFVVRAIVADPAKRAAFDAWYQNEHVPDALKAFGITRAKRFWSSSDPSLHLAMYEFSDQAALERATGGDALKPLVAEFERCWPDVTRSREVLVLAHEVGG
jgi:hypothetical protein